MASTQDRFLETVEQLASRTQSGNIKWKKTDSEDTFLFSGSKSSVIVTKWNDRDGDPMVRVSILNSTGDEIGRLESEYLHNPWNETTRYTDGENNALLEALWESARRTALNIDEVLDSLLDDLGN